MLIPDAVFYEATAAAAKLGAQEIIRWRRERVDLVRIEPTTTFQNEITARRNPAHLPMRDMGERAALEVMRDEAVLADDAVGLFISDDRDAARFLVTDTARAVLLTTWDFLLVLEQNRRIQSADAVVERARDAGRFSPRRRVFDQHDADIRDEVARLLGLDPED